MDTHLLGASIIIGALIPRYNREKPSFLMIFLKQSTIPLYPSPPTPLPCWSCLSNAIRTQLLMQTDPIGEGTLEF